MRSHGVDGIFQFVPNRSSTYKYHDFVWLSHTLLDRCIKTRTRRRWVTRGREKTYDSRNDRAIVSSRRMR